jgi:hypothetical protein
MPRRTICKGIKRRSQFSGQCVTIMQLLRSNAMRGAKRRNLAARVQLLDACRIRIGDQKHGASRINNASNENPSMQILPQSRSTICLSGGDE